MSVMEREFERWKRRSEQKLDQSKKGSVDADILPLVCLINGKEEYFTTSSCSGRVILIDGNSESSDIQKQNCVWLFVSHQKCTAEQLIEGLSRSSGDAVFKFEPFVLHVQCRRLEDAQLMHSVAINSGFRNSGLTVGKTGKIISAIRSTHGLEVPLSHQGTVLVTHEYIHFLCQISNQKMNENLRRINRFFESLQTALTVSDVPKLYLPECLIPPQHLSLNGDKPEKETEQKVYRRRRRRERTRQKQTNCPIDGKDASDCPHDDGKDTSDCPHDDRKDTSDCPHDDGKDTSDCPHVGGKDTSDCPHNDNKDTSDRPHDDGKDTSDCPHDDGRYQ